MITLDGTLGITTPSETNTGTLSVTGVTTLTGGFTVGATAAPAFSAYLAATQNVTNATWTKITFNTEIFDTNSNFDAATNYRFTPTVAGYYQINGAYAANSTATNPNQVNIAIYKNGSAYNYVYTAGSQVALASVNISSVVYFNGSTDYVEFYAYMNTASGTPQVYQSGSIFTYASGAMIRSA